MYVILATGISAVDVIMVDDDEQREGGMECAEGGSIVGSAIAIIIISCICASTRLIPGIKSVSARDSVEPLHRVSAVEQQPQDRGLKLSLADDAAILFSVLAGSN